MTTYFVTGTDTGAGKTFVSAALLRRARARGKTVFGFKPIETGCEMVDGEMSGSDQRVLCDAAGGWQKGHLAGMYRLKNPVAPLVAASAERLLLDVDRIVATALETAATIDVTVVEGAGGWRVPLTPSADIASLATKLGAPVIIAARAGLGTINHSLLTIEAVERDGCRIAALVLSRRAEDDAPFTEQNAAEIRRRWPGQVLVLGPDESALDPLL